VGFYREKQNKGFISYAGRSSEINTGIVKNKIKALFHMQADPAKSTQESEICRCIRKSQAADFSLMLLWLILY